MVHLKLKMFEVGEWENTHKLMVTINITVQTKRVWKVCQRDVFNIICVYRICYNIKVLNQMCMLILPTVCTYMYLELFKKDSSWSDL